MKNAEASFIKRTSSFFQEVRSETKKVTWPSRRETVLTTVVVFIFAVIAAIFFTLVDQVVYRLLQYIIG